MITFTTGIKLKDDSFYNRDETEANSFYNRDETES